MEGKKDSTSCNKEACKVQPGQVKQGLSPLTDCSWTSTSGTTLTTPCNALTGGSSATTFLLCAYKTSGTYKNQLGIGNATGLTSGKQVRIGMDFDNSYGVIQTIYESGSPNQLPLLLNPEGSVVGIGTTSPEAELSINGGLHVGGDSDPGDNNALIDGRLQIKGQPCARAHLDMDQSVASGAWTLMSFSIENFDVASNFDTGTYKFTAPVDGYYEVNARITWDATAAGKVYGAYLHVNNSGVSVCYAASDVTGTIMPSCVISDILKLTANDYVTLKGYHNTGSAINAVSGTIQSFLSVRLVQ